MGSEIEIIGGGAVAVDTITLRHTASRFLAASDELQALGARLGALQNMLLSERAHAWEAASAASALGTRLNQTFHGAQRIAGALREAAAIYELVELNAEHRAAVLAGDAVAASRLDAAREALMTRHPGAIEAAVGAEFERSVMWPSDLVRQSTETGVALGSELDERWAVYLGAAAGLGAIGLGATAGVGGFGRIGAGERLISRGDAVTIAPVPSAAVGGGAPAGLAAVAQRMPGPGGAQVRVEAYTMPDGARQFAVYVAGTRSMGAGGRDPWDNLSNGQLYAGRSSASYEATVAALDAAGARPGDVVHAFGHSQGAMITAHLALDGGYDVRTHVTFGSPVEADVGSGTLSVAVRHTDDPVTALAGGGHVTPVGAPGSFVAEREADPASGVHDVRLSVHLMPAYAETAELVDRSDDPRVDALHTALAELSDAIEVEVTEYVATRPDG